jgi:hypothetical protein
MYTDDRFGPVDIGQGECVIERDAAILVTMADEYGSQVDRWIPKSCLHDDSEVYKYGHVGKVVVRAWWAEEKNWGVVARRPSGADRPRLILKPPTKKWLKDQKARTERRTPR